MYVDNIYWISEEIKEAKLIITDGVYKCTAFLHPCFLNIGDMLHKPLLSYESKNIMVALKKNYFISPISSSSFEHKGIGKIIDRKKGLICVGNIEILLNNIPKDIIEGDFIEFTSIRLDILD